MRPAGVSTAEGVAETAADSASTDDVIGRLVDEAQAEGLTSTGPGRIQRVLRRLPPSFEAGTRPHPADITKGSTLCTATNDAIATSFHPDAHE
jgi:hypothetical protein